MSDPLSQSTHAISRFGQYGLPASRGGASPFTGAASFNRATAGQNLSSAGFETGSEDQFTPSGNADEFHGPNSGGVWLTDQEKSQLKHALGTLERQATWERPQSSNGHSMQAPTFNFPKGLTQIQNPLDNQGGIDFTF